MLWRYDCFGSQSGAGRRFGDRILMLTATSRQHGISALAYLTRAIVAFRSGAQTTSFPERLREAHTGGSAAEIALTGILAVA